MTVATSRRRNTPRTKGTCAMGCIVCTAIAMMLEYEEVLTRLEHREATGMTVEEVGAFLDGFAAFLRPVFPYFLWRPRLRNPDDEMVLDAAVNGQAEAIVTFHVPDYLPAARQFHLEVLTPAEALQRLRRR